MNLAASHSVSIQRRGWKWTSTLPLLPSSSSPSLHPPQHPPSLLPAPPAPVFKISAAFFHPPNSAPFPPPDTHPSLPPSPPPLRRWRPYIDRSTSQAPLLSVTFLREQTAAAGAGGSNPLRPTPPSERSQKKKRKKHRKGLDGNLAGHLCWWKTGIIVTILFLFLF